MLLEKRTYFWDNIHNFYAIFLPSLHCGHDLQVLLLQKCKCFAWYTKKPDLYQTTLETDIQKLIDFIWLCQYTLSFLLLFPFFFHTLNSSDWRILDFVMVTPLVGDFVIGPRPLLFFALTNIFLCKHPLIKRPPERKNNLETLKEKNCEKTICKNKKAYLIYKSCCQSSSKLWSVS